MTEKRATARRGTPTIDPETGALRMAAAAAPITDPTDAEQVYGAYLSLLYAVRGARRGEEIPLRSTDLDALLSIVGDDVERIERRLVELMGCTAEEATLLRRVLVRHRNLAASVGAVAGISLVALLGTSPASATSPAGPAPSSAVVTSAEPTELPPLTTYLTTDDGAHVPIPGASEPTPAAGVEGEVATASPQPSVSPTPHASASPSAGPSPVPSPAPPAAPAVSPSPAPPAPSASSSAAPAPSAPADDDVVVEATTPDDQAEPAPAEAEPVDPNEGTPRIGWSPEYAVEPGRES